MLIFSLDTYVANERIDDCGNHNLEELTILDANEDAGVAPCYNTVCGSYSYHRMVSRGFGFVDNPDGSSYLTATYRAEEAINSNGCYIRQAHSYGYTDKNYLDGYKFYIEGA